MPSPTTMRVHKALSTAVFLIGCLLMAGKMYADSEPGAIPLAMLVIGAVWHVTTRMRSRTRQP